MSRTEKRQADFKNGQWDTAFVADPEFLDGNRIIQPIRYIGIRMGLKPILSVSPAQQLSRDTKITRNGMVQGGGISFLTDNSQILDRRIEQTHFQNRDPV
ncbi:hypothetical protein Ddc_08154 [Ditylenchus destructor]|nr:hypothetical protein Ddc_08154 [Ditylenchus destructor]